MNMDFFAGYKTFIAALGLAGMACWQFSQGDYPGAWQSLMAALALYGVKMAINRQSK